LAYSKPKRQTKQKSEIKSRVSKFYLTYEQIYTESTSRGKAILVFLRKPGITKLTGSSMLNDKILTAATRKNPHKNTQTKLLAQDKIKF
jgi:hypothetical protein